MHRKTISTELITQILSPEFQKRFWSKIEKAGPDDCWRWKGCTSSGYGKLMISCNGIRNCLRSHVVAWIINNKKDVPDSMCVRHSCIATPSCCNPNHLSTGTQKQNLQDMDEQGRRVVLRGEQVPAHKLTNEIVILVRELYKTGRFKQTELGKMVGVAGPVICNIVNRKSWTHI